MRLLAHRKLPVLSTAFGIVFVAAAVLALWLAADRLVCQRPPHLIARNVLLWMVALDLAAIALLLIFTAIPRYLTVNYVAGAILGSASFVGVSNQRIEQNAEA